jgi:YaaC-like Protein
MARKVLVFGLRIYQPFEGKDTESMILTWTDQPEQTLWDQIMVFSHSGNLKSLLTDNLKSKRIPIQNQKYVDEKSKEASFAIQQANEYFLAAKSVTVSTSPLLYYYGMLSLVKALVVCNSEELLFSDIKYHGLTAKNPSRNNSIPTPQALAEQRAWINGGAFNELFKLHYPSNGENIIGNSLKLIDLLKTDPQLKLLFDRQFDGTSGCVGLYTTGKTDEGRMFVDVFSHESEIKSRMPALEKHVTFLPGYHAESVKVTANSGFEFNKIATKYRIRAGGKCLRANPVSTDPQGDVKTTFLSVEECDFIVMFILSDCVRYKQEMWRRCQVAGEDSCFPLINSFITNSIRRLPNFFLDRLLGECHEFAGAAFYT